MTLYLGKQQVAMTMNHIDESAVAQKVDKVTTPNIVYGTDSNGDQTTYDKNSFGQVDDVKVNGTSVVTDKVANITLGTMASETASEYTKTTNLATVATSGSYNDLSDKPSIPTAQVNSDWNATSGVAQILNKPTLGTMSSENTTSYYTKTELDGKLDSKQDEATAVNYDNITNCITKIPQDIKLELKDGTLTLKAGSKVYVPNGAGVFNVVTVASDITNTTTGAGEKMFLSVYNNGAHLFAGYTTGGTVTERPDSPINYALYYNTTTNKVEFYNGSSWISNCSFPISLYTRGSTDTTFIDQVFNGFGYIGSTIFALPGVKGLIPNGRNTDGSLKNIEFVNPEVRTINVSGTYNTKLALATTGLGSYFYAYDEVKNEIYNAITGDYYPSDRLIVGDISYTNSVITSFTPKTAFHALDYNDRETIVGWGMPDYSAGITIPQANAFPYTAPSDGLLLIAASSYSDVKNEFFINGNSVAISWSATSGTATTFYQPVYMKKGETVTTTRTQNAPVNNIFYPLKGTV